MQYLRYYVDCLKRKEELKVKNTSCFKHVHSEWLQANVAYPERWDSNIRYVQIQSFFNIAKIKFTIIVLHLFKEENG